MKNDDFHTNVDEVRNIDQRGRRVVKVLTMSTAGEDAALPEKIILIDNSTTGIFHCSFEVSKILHRILRKLRFLSVSFSPVTLAYF
jgi:hypothetical protein